MKYSKLTISLVVGISLLTGCETVNTQTVQDMPTGYLCEMLGPDWMGLPSEYRAIYAELEERGAECVATSRVIIENR